VPRRRSAPSSRVSLATRPFSQPVPPRPCAFGPSATLRDTARRRVLGGACGPSSRNIAPDSRPVRRVWGHERRSRVEKVNRRLMCSECGGYPVVRIERRRYCRRGRRRHCRCPSHDRWPTIGRGTGRWSGGASPGLRLQRRSTGDERRWSLGYPRVPSTSSFDRRSRSARSSVSSSRRAATPRRCYTPVAAGDSRPWRAHLDSCTAQFLRS